MAEQIDIEALLKKIEETTQLRPAEGTSLSSMYKKIMWICPQGHYTESTLERMNMKKIKGCKECRRILAGKEDRLFEIELKEGGYTIDRIIRGAFERTVHVTCPAAHHFSLNVLSAYHQQGFFCPFCSGKAEYTIEEIRHLVESKGGNLHDLVFHNNLHKLTVTCSQNHTFRLLGRQIKKGTWCPYCKAAGPKKVRRQRTT